MTEAQEASRDRKGQTGPKTVAGKRKSARNAKKHGFSAKKYEVNTATERICQLASALAAGFSSQSSAIGLIQQAAESQNLIEQVRRLKAEVIANGVCDRIDSLARASSTRMRTVSLDWQRLERYERLAFKRRQEAFLKIAALEASWLGKASAVLVCCRVALTSTL